jgi:hypothetical protein
MPAPVQSVPLQPTQPEPKDELSVLRDQIEKLQQTLSNFEKQQKTPRPFSTQCKINKPKEFHGARKDTVSFLTQCELVFMADPTAFSAHHRILYVASFLRDEAFDWFQAAVVQTNREFTVYEEFTTLFKSVFGKDVSV